MKLLPLSIQYLALVSASVSFTPLWQMRSWACFTIRLVRGWLLGSRIGYLAAYGISMLASLPPQHQTHLSSLKRLNCLVRDLPLSNLHPKEFSSQGFFHNVHWRVDCLSSLQVLEFADCLEYPCHHSNQSWECAEHGGVQTKLYGHIRLWTVGLGGLQLQSIFSWHGLHFTLKAGLRACL